MHSKHAYALSLEGLPGPLHSFWCFSFERYNGMLEKMQKSWKAPEIQLIHKFSNLQALACSEVSQDIPIELKQCLVKMKHEKTSLPNAVIDSFSLLKYENNTVCSTHEVCATKYSFQQPLTPIREKYFTEIVRDALNDMYCAIYGKEFVVQVPLRYEEFYQLKIFKSVLSTSKSRSSKSTAVIAAWPSPSGILTGRKPMPDDVRVGTIEYFFSHQPTILLCEGDANRAVATPHLLARVKWFQDHPQKFLLKNGIVIASTVYESEQCSTFIPVSRIITQCATVTKYLQLSYGEDHVCIALHLRSIAYILSINGLYHHNKTKTTLYIICLLILSFNNGVYQ